MSNLPVKDNHVHAWTNGNVVITHNELFESFALEIFE